MRSPQEVSSFPQPKLFTLWPRSGGRHARKGYEFQDWYAAFILTGFLSEEEDFAVMRIEGTEDIDILLRSSGSWVERYCQVKSKKEGTGSWTFTKLEDKNVFSNLFDHYRQFCNATENTRRVEFVIAVEGDLAEEVLLLKEQNPGSKRKLFALLCLRQLLLKENAYQRARHDIQMLYEKWGTISEGKELYESSVENDTLKEIARKAGCPTSNVQHDIINAAKAISPLIGQFVSTLMFESRISVSRDTILGRLLQGGDVSPEEASEAIDGLMQQIVLESSLPEPTSIDRNVFRSWLGIPDRLKLQTKPRLEQELIQRDQLLSNLADLINKSPTIVLHGLPKVGKSMLVSALLDRLQKGNNYFWFTFTGEPGDLSRLMKLFSLWFGNKTSIWQPRDDVEQGRLRQNELFERLSRIAIEGTVLVFDDCQKCSDKNLLTTIKESIGTSWPDCRVILISEHRLPEVEVFGVAYQAIGGFTPRESLEFVTKLGLDVSRALLEFTMLAVQVDGHPVMLRAIAQELPNSPSETDLRGLRERLPENASASSFLQVLSKKFLDLARTPEQRVWVSRLSELSFSFDRALALTLANLKPKITISPADWNYLRALILEEISSGRFQVPLLVRSIAKDEFPTPSSHDILMAAAHHLLRRFSPSRAIDFWDFHNAIVYLVVIGEVEEAAVRFILSYPSLLKAGSFEPVEFLFLILNGEMVHLKISEPNTKWLLLQAEATLRVQDPKAFDGPKILTLVRRMRALLRLPWKDPLVINARPQIHTLISSVRVRLLASKVTASQREMQRAFAPLQTALRLAVMNAMPELVSALLGLYDDIHILARHPDVGLLRTAVLLSPETDPSPISAEALITLYARYASSEAFSDASLVILREHSAEFRARGLNDAYFACEHAIATILHDGQGKYAEARAQIEGIRAESEKLGLSQESRGRADLFIADTYWAQRDYAKSSTLYENVLRSGLVAKDLMQHVIERLADGLIFLGRYEEARSTILRAIRTVHMESDPRHLCNLYGRLAFACAKGANLKQAAIACLALIRISSRDGSDELDAIAGTISGWVLYQIDFKTPGIPRNEVIVRDSSAISDPVAGSDTSRWRKKDPFKTKATILVASIFEVLGDFRRCGFLVRKELKKLEAVPIEQSEKEKTKWIYLLRLARILLGQGKVRDAANVSKKAFDSQARISPPASMETSGRGARAYGMFKAIDLTWYARNGEELQTFMDTLTKLFAEDSEVMAWLLYWESEVLFSKLAVQAAKRRLKDSNDLAQRLDDCALMWITSRDILFYHVQLFYRNHTEWIRDAIDAAAILKDDSCGAKEREDFAGHVDRFAHSQTRPPLADVAVTIDALRAHWSDLSFQVVTYALWRTAKSRFVLSGKLGDIEAYLKQSAKFPIL